MLLSPFLFLKEQRFQTQVRGSGWEINNMPAKEKINAKALQSIIYNVNPGWFYNYTCFVFFVFFCFSNNPTHKYFMAVDPVSGALFISDTNSRRIYRVRSLTGGRLLSDNAEVVAGTGEQCLPFDERCGDGGKATEATLMSPKGEPLRGNFTSQLTSYCSNCIFLYYSIKCGYRLLRHPSKWVLLRRLCDPQFSSQDV